MIALEILFVAVLAMIWLVTMFLVVADSMSAGAKTVWLLAVIVLAPFAVPVYLVVRRRRHRTAAFT